MSQSKANFIKTAEKKIEMYAQFQYAIDIILANVSKYNGKVMNIRFTKFINGLLENQNLSVRISFDTNWNGERNNRFRLTFIDKSYTLDSNTCVNTLYPGKNPEYINEDFKLNADNFSAVLIDEQIRCEDYKVDYEKGIKNVDVAISLYKDLEEYISTHIDKLPDCLQNKKYKYLDCPVY